MAKRQLTQAAQAAAQIRKQLKKHGVPAKVTSSNYSMGSSVTVKLLNDPLPATVKLVTEFANQYQQGHFDGMQDLYEYSNRREDIPQAKYVFVNAEYTAETREAAQAWVENRFADPQPSHILGDMVHRALNGTMAGFWADRKPRVRAA